MEEIIYKIGGRKRPVNSRYVRILYLLMYIPYIRKYVCALIKRYYKMPASVAIYPGFNCSSSMIQVGENTGLGNLKIIAWAPVSIGERCSFSFDNIIITSTHDLNDFSTVIGRSVTIGNHVWITSKVTILPGVTIGDNTIIGAGSVVTHDIPSGVLAAGNPCKVIKKIGFR